MPCLYDAIDKSTTEFREHTLTFGEATPKVKFEEFKVIDVMSLLDYMEKTTSDDVDLRAEARKAYDIPNKYNIDDFTHYSFRISWLFTNTWFVKEWGFQVRAETGDGKLIFDKEVAVSTDGCLGNTKKVVDYDFVCNQRGTEYGKCPTVRVRPYVITKSGEKKVFVNPKESVNNVGLKYPQDNDLSAPSDGEWNILTVK